MAYTGTAVTKAITRAMNYFQKPIVNIGEQRVRYVKLDPRSPLDITANSEVEFNIPANATDQIDLSRSSLEMTISFSKKDSSNHFAYNGNFEHEENEYLILLDGFLQTQWKNVMFAVGNKTVLNSQNDHSYRAYIDMRLHVTDDELDETKENWLFTRETGMTQEDQPHPWKGHNRGAQYRFRRIQHRQKIELSGPLGIELWRHKDVDFLPYLIHNTSYQFKLTPATDNFRFQVTPASLADNFEYHLHRIQLNLCYITLSPEALQGFEAALLKEPVMYSYIRHLVKIIPLHKGIRERRCPDIFDTVVPMDVTMVMVDRDAFAGEFDRNPFFFKRNNIARVAFYQDGIPIPNEPLTFGPEEPDAVLPADKGVDETLTCAIKEIHRVARTTKNGFFREKLVFGSGEVKDKFVKGYGNGHFIICIQTDPTADPTRRLWGVPKTGNLSLILDFHEQLPTEQQLIIIARYPGLMSIDKARNVTVM